MIFIILTDRRYIFWGYILTNMLLQYFIVKEGSIFGAFIILIDIYPLKTGVLIHKKQQAMKYVPPHLATYLELKLSFSYVYRNTSGYRLPFKNFP